MSKHVLDQWILSKLHQLINVVTKSLESYDVTTAANSIETFVADFSQWYVRRSRDRVGSTVEDSEEKENCYVTLYEVLVTLTKLLAPFTPFLAEEIYRNLTDEESVHLVDWPKENIRLINESLERQMILGRKLVEVGNSIRKEHKIKTRQPLALAWHNEPKKKLIDIDVLRQVLQELNIKGWIHEDNFEKFIKTEGVVSKEIDGFIFYLDTRLTDDLKFEGKARELIRQIQLLRKEKGCRIDERIEVQMPKDYQHLTKYLEYIKKETLADRIIWGESLDILTG